MKNTSKETVANAGPLKQAMPDQSTFPYWGIPIVLIVLFVVLKMFIYIKDGDRHGK